MNYLIFQASPWWLILIFGIVLCLAIEVPFQARRLAREISFNKDAFSAVQAGLLTLASFVLGLSFSQAQGRFDARRALVIKEANAIGTTWLRADQLDKAERQRFRQILIDYTSTRLQAYEGPAAESESPNKARYEAELRRSDRDQDEMWNLVSPALLAHSDNLGLSLLMQTLNDTIDVSAEQLQALTTHVPTAVIELTLALVVLAGLSLGLRFAVDGSRPAVLSTVYVVASVIVVTMMVDYDRPQTGFVRVNLNPIKVQLQSMESSP
jgi:hypothetical protein